MLFGDYEDKIKVLEEINFINKNLKGYFGNNIITKINEREDYKKIKVDHKINFEIKEPMYLNSEEYCEFLNKILYV
jgi:hypothetical protein